MRNTFKEGELPAETPRRSAGSDVSSFQQVYQALLDVDKKCSEPHGQPGWHPVGKEQPYYPNHINGKKALIGDHPGDLNSIGVFLWQSASEINQRTQLVGDTNSSTSANGGSVNGWIDVEPSDVATS